MVEMITNINSKINGFVWGAPAMVLILGVGLWLTIGTGFVQFRRFGYAMRNTIGKAFVKVEVKEGAVSPFTAMCTALAATVGTGNIAGVTGAIFTGGSAVPTGTGSGVISGSGWAEARFSKRSFFCTSSPTVE